MYFCPWLCSLSPSLSISNDSRRTGNLSSKTQEAVRQFDQVIPGEYQLYAHFKESSRGNKSVRIKGLIYTKDASNQQRGENYFKTVPLHNSRVLLGKVILRQDGTYQVIR